MYSEYTVNFLLHIHVYRYNPDFSLTCSESHIYIVLPALPSLCIMRYIYSQPAHEHHKLAASRVCSTPFKNSPIFSPSSFHASRGRRNASPTRAYEMSPRRPTGLSFA